MLCVLVELSFFSHESPEEEDLTGGVGRSDGPIRDAAGVLSHETAWQAEPVMALSPHP